MPQQGPTVFEERPLSSPSQKPANDTPHDPIEDLVHSIPIVLPVVGGVLIFLLAFIDISMA